MSGPGKLRLEQTVSILMSVLNLSFSAHMHVYTLQACSYILICSWVGWSQCCLVAACWCDTEGGWLEHSLRLTCYSGVSAGN